MAERIKGVAVKDVEPRSPYFAYYNFCRIHSSIRCTPAMESGLTGHIWTLRELLVT
jgi:hypothetical protein